MYGFETEDAHEGVNFGYAPTTPSMVNVPFVQNVTNGASSRQTNNVWELWLHDENGTEEGSSNDIQSPLFTPIHKFISTVQHLDSILSYVENQEFRVGCAYVFFPNGMTSSGYGKWTESPFNVERHIHWGHLSHWRFECINLMHNNSTLYATKIEKLPDGKIRIFSWGSIPRIPGTPLYPME